MDAGIYLQTAHTFIILSSDVKIEESQGAREPWDRRDRLRNQKSCQSQLTTHH